MTGDKEREDELLRTLAYADPSSIIPPEFQGLSDQGTLLKMVRFLARRILELEKNNEYPLVHVRGLP